MLFKPKTKVARVTDLTPEMLRRRGITALLLDVDNTLSTHHGMVLTDGLTEWIEMMQSAGIRLLVLSNSKEARVKPFAEKIGLDYISLGLKPLPMGYIRGLRRMGVKRRDAAIVGDQIFTDVLGGSLVGVHTVLLTPIKLEDKLSFKIRRKIERWLYKLYRLEDQKE